MWGRTVYLCSSHLFVWHFRHKVTIFWPSKNSPISPFHRFTTIHFVDFDYSSLLWGDNFYYLKRPVFRGFLGLWDLCCLLWILGGLWLEGILVAWGPHVSFVYRDQVHSVLSLLSFFSLTPSLPPPHTFSTSLFLLSFLRHLRTPPPKPPNSSILYSLLSVSASNSPTRPFKK